MIYLVCRECQAGLRISPGEDGELENLFGPGSEHYPDRFPCFRCEKHIASFVQAMDVQTLAVLELHDVNAKEAWAALHGLGVPEERECSASAVEKALLSSPVVKVRVKPIRNSSRCVLEHLELEDGTKVYIGSSSLGGVVYRMAKPHSYAEQVG